MKHSNIYDKIYPSRKKDFHNPSNAQKKADVLKSKLGKYAAISTVLVAGIPNIASATIQSTSVNAGAGTTLTQPAIAAAPAYRIDFDNDGNNDISINISFDPGDSDRVTPNVFVGSARVFQTSTFTASVRRLVAGDTISSLATGGQFTSNTAGTFKYLAFFNPPSIYTNFAGEGTSYVGVAFSINNQTHYGWVELSVSNDGKQITINSFAYEDCPCQGIIAGAITGGPGAVCPPANCPFNPNPQVPTLSEWGLITLAVLLLTFGTLYIGRREEILAAQASEGKQFKMGYAWQKSPFEWAVFWKTLLATAGLAAVAGALSWFAYGSIAAVDVVGTAIAGPIFAYWMHLLWIFERDND